MGLFKKRVRVEDFAGNLVSVGIPRAIAFFEEENVRARYRLAFADEDLKNIGAGLCLFFLSEQLQDAKKANHNKMQRATKSIRRALNKLGGNSDKGQEWWKLIDDDYRIIHEHKALLDVACQAVWNRRFRDRPFKEHGALRSFAYFLQVEVDASAKVKLI